MQINSRLSIQEKPRNLNKKNPGKTYLPRFLDESDLSTLKSSVDRELADIAMYMEKERQVVSRIVPGSIFKGTWDACTDKYPDPKEENSTWDVIVTCGETHDFDNKTWKAGQQLMWLQTAEVWVQRTNPSVEGIVERVDKLEVKTDNSNANINDLKLAVADTNFALAQTKQELEAKVNDNTSKINQTNEVVADLTTTVATNKTELSSSIQGVKDIVDKNKSDGDKADAENKQLIVQAQSDIVITNQTLADLDKTVATNKTELESKYQGIVTTVEGIQHEVTETNANLAQTNQTIADLEGSLALNVTELKAEYKAADAQVKKDAADDATGKANKVAAEAAAALAITNQTVANLEGSMSQNITQLESAYKAADNVVAKNAADDAQKKADKVAADAAAALKVTNETIANLEGSMSQNITQLESSYKAADVKVKEDAAVDAQKRADKVAIEADAALQITNQTVSDLDKALSQNVLDLRAEYKTADNTLDGKLTGNIDKVAADLKVTNQTVADNKQAAATATSNLKAEMDGKVAGINTEMSAVVNRVGNVETRWGIEMNANGHISGVSMNNDGNRSNFTVLTDRFVVTDGATVRPPFSIEGGRVAMKDAVVSGIIQATAGEFRNVTIHGDCQILGNLNVNQVQGNMSYSYLIPYASGTYGEAWSEVYIPPQGFNRKLFIIGSCSARRRLSSGSIDLYCRAVAYLDGNVLSEVINEEGAVTVIGYTTIGAGVGATAKIRSNANGTGTGSSAQVYAGFVFTERI